MTERERSEIVHAERPVSAGHSVVAGLGTSVVSTLVCHPFELVRAREQAIQLSKRRPLLHMQSSSSRKKKPSLMEMCFTDLREMCAIVKEEGLNGLYQGAGTHFFGHLTSGIVFFAAQSVAQVAVDRFFGIPSSGVVAETMSGRFTRRVIASSIAGCVQVCATHPIWVVKNRQQLKRRDKQVQRLKASSNPFSLCWNWLNGSAAKKRRKQEMERRQRGVVGNVQHWIQRSALGQMIVLGRKEGLAGLFSGLVPSILLTIHTSIQYAAYDELKSVIVVDLKHGKPLTAMDRFVASIGAKSIAAIIGNPTTVLRTRLMQKNCPYHGVRDCLTRIVREEGPLTLFRGTSAALWKVLAAGVTMPCYDYVATKTKKYFL